LTFALRTERTGDGGRAIKGGFGRPALLWPWWLAASSTSP